MNNFILVLLFLGCLFLSYICICLWERIYIRQAYGKIILKIDLVSFNLEIRSKYFICFPLNDVIVRRYIREYFNTNYQYYDEKLLKNMLYVFNDDIILNSQTDLGSIFYYSRFSKLRVSHLGISYIEKYYKYDKFKNVDLAKLLIHEYLHHWSNKHNKNPDINHVGRCWRTIN